MSEKISLDSSVDGYYKETWELATYTRLRTSNNL